MQEQRHKGHILAIDDKVHGASIARIRIKDSDSPFNGKKCRVESTGGGYVPKKSDEVTFLVGKTQDSGNEVMQAYDVRPWSGVETEPKPVEEREPVNWFIVRRDGKYRAIYFGCKSVLEAQAEMDNEEVVTMVPFRIGEHLDDLDEPEAENAFALVEALTMTTPTLQALEALMSALVQATADKLGK